MKSYPLGYKSAVYYVQFVNYTEFSKKNIAHKDSREAAGGKHTDDTVLRHVARLSTQVIAHAQFLRHTML
jgi:hypothetical protein